MKLSKKGFKKIISTCKFDDAIATYTLNFSSPDKDYCFEVQGTSFKSNDFEDCVMLTIEEAKEIIGTYIGTNCEIVKQHGIPELKIKNPNWLIHLLERIEQAEVAKIGEDYNKALNKVVEEFQKQAEKP